MRASEAPSTRALRGWQRRALVRYLTAKPRDFLLVATPGAGKTAFALRIAAELLADRSIDTITVVVPTEHLKMQWALAAAADGIALGRQHRRSLRRRHPPTCVDRQTIPQRRRRDPLRPLRARIESVRGLTA